MNPFWTGAASTLIPLETPRGFTGHEHLDKIGFAELTRIPRMQAFRSVHNNGRVYDPTLGRFLSADPTVQYPACGLFARLTQVPRT